MRTGLILGGALALGLGLYGVYDEYFIVVEFIKGALQPLIGLIGLVALLYGVVSPRRKRAHLAFGLALLGVGIYGLFDEYFAVIDFLKGAIPLLLLGGGVVSVVSGARQLESLPTGSEP